MNEEEIKAIEYIKNCSDNVYRFRNATREKDEKYSKILLNLIENQQKEIEEKNQLIERMKTFLLKNNLMCDFLESEE